MSALGGRLDELGAAVDILDDKHVGLLLAVMVYGVVFFMLIIGYCVHQSCGPADMCQRRKQQVKGDVELEGARTMHA